MEKNRWLDFISSRLKSQISIENAEKAQIWALAILGFMTLGFALQTVGASTDPVFLNSTKILFLILSHVFILIGFYLPSLLRKGEKPLAGLLGIRDMTSLIVISLTLTFYAFITVMLSQQILGGGSSREAANSAFFSFVAWVNFFMSLTYFAGCLSFLICVSFSPSPLMKLLERGAKTFYVFFGLHITLAFLLGFGYAETVSIGSANFFEQFRVAGLFWAFMVTSVLFIGKLLRGSAVPSLSAIELDVAAGRLERQEDILSRVKEAFILRRLAHWINRVSHQVSTRAHEIAQYCHNAVALVSNDKPTELDLRQVDDRYRRADHLYRKLEKESLKFLLSVSFFDLTESEQEKTEELKDQFSRELRNAKIELAGIRKRIDERLVALKNIAALAPQAQLPSPAPSPTVPVENIPLSK